MQPIARTGDHPMETDARLGLTRPRDDSEAGPESESSSPRRPKSARTSLDSTASSSSSERDLHIEPEQADDRTADALAEELECGMCAGVFIEPVALNGCGHVFCGSCVMQWIKSMPKYPASLLPGDPVPEPISCPHCRHAPIQTATPCRLAKTMVGILLASRPDVGRPPNEHRQAEVLYKASTGVIKFPTPPPPPRQLQHHEFWRPCRFCYPTGEGQWRCPQPVPRFEVPAERDRCLRADGLCPDGHRLCAGCERLCPSDGPQCSSCNICGEGFCGDSHSGCDCALVSASKPTNQFHALPYMLEDCPSDMLATAFKDNWTEMYHLGVYLGNNEHLTAQQIYKHILEWLRTPEALESGGILAMMNRADINIRLRTGMADEMQQAVMSAGDSATEARICGGCADEIFCAGLFEWWMRELKKPEVLQARPVDVRNRPNCKFGRTCGRQDSDNHAKKYNHICDAMPEDQARNIHQDDIMPARTTTVPEPDTSSTPESDEGASDDDDDDPPNYTDVGTQWEAGATGVEVTRRTSGLNSAWVAHSDQTRASVPSSSSQAFSIASLVHERPDTPPASQPQAQSDWSSRPSQTPTWQTASSSQTNVLGLRPSHQPPPGYPNLFESANDPVNLSMSSKLPPLQTGSKLPSLFNMQEASSSARKLDSSSVDIEQQ